MPRFQYRRIHIPTGQENLMECDATDRRIFLEWINAWNHNDGSWLYLATIRLNSKMHLTNMKLVKVIKKVTVT